MGSHHHRVGDMHVASMSDRMSATALLGVAGHSDITTDG